MTALSTDMMDGTRLRVISSSLTLKRLGELTRESRVWAGWWVEVTRQLDDLAESVLSTPGDVVDTGGFTEQLRADAPHLMGRWQRLAGERDGLYAAVTEVRLLAGRSAGDPSAVSSVSRAIRDVIGRVRRFQERTSEVLLDAYERDIGGE
jgi:hypothetical protein